MIWNEPIGSTGSASGAINEMKLNGGWPYVRTLVQGEVPCFWFPVGFVPSDPLPLITVTDGRADADPRIKNLIDTYQREVVRKFKRVLAYFGQPRSAMTIEEGWANLRPFRGSEFILDKTAQFTEEWRSKFLMLQEWSGKVLTLEGWPQVGSIWQNFGCYFMLKSLPTKGPNGMTLDQIADSSFPKKYCLIRSDNDLPAGNDRAGWIAELENRGITVITRW